MNTGDLAVLIKADNASPRVVAGVMAEAAKCGTPSVKRIYGDWTNPWMRGWRKCVLEHSIVPMQLFAYKRGRNATDGAMIIDAMDFLHTGRFSSFCLVSSDSDFAHLAARIREQGVWVYGFGDKSNTGRVTVAACNEFVYFDALPVPLDEPNEPVAPSPASSKSGPQDLQRSPATIEPRPLDQAALDVLRQAVLNSNIIEEDYVDLSEIGDYLTRNAPDLHPRFYDYQRLSEFVKSSGIIQVKMKDMRNGASITLVHLMD